MIKRTFIICLLGFTALLFGERVPSFPPGTYGKDIVLDMQAVGGEKLSYSFAGTADYAPFEFPVELTALEGEERKYDLNIREHYTDGSEVVYR